MMVVALVLAVVAGCVIVWCLCLDKWFVRSFGCFFWFLFFFISFRRKTNQTEFHISHSCKLLIHFISWLVHAYRLVVGMLLFLLSYFLRCCCCCSTHIQCNICLSRLIWRQNFVSSYYLCYCRCHRGWCFCNFRLAFHLSNMISTVFCTFSSSSSSSSVSPLTQIQKKRKFHKQSIHGFMLVFPPFFSILLLCFSRACSYTYRTCYASIYCWLDTKGGLFLCWFFFVSLCRYCVCAIVLAYSIACSLILCVLLVYAPRHTLTHTRARARRYERREWNFSEPFSSKLNCVRGNSSGLAALNCIGKDVCGCEIVYVWCDATRCDPMRCNMKRDVMWFNLMSFNGGGGGGAQAGSMCMSARIIIM